jgi:hypothetical protein
MWRVSGDFWDNWPSLDHEFELARRWQRSPGAAHWPDADMLPLGHLSIHGRSVGADRRSAFTKNEQITLISLWCLLPSPLMLGGNVAELDPWTEALLTNPEVLAVNQDPAGNAAVPDSKDGDMETWVKKLADGSLAVGIFNRGELDADAPFPPAARSFAHVRDLWLHRDLGRLGPTKHFSVPAHGAVLLLCRA